MRRSTLAGSFLLAAVVAAASGCGKGQAEAPKSVPQRPDPKGTEGDDEAALVEKYKDVLELPKVRYAWDPAAGDPSVPAELGGPGFTGEGWTTSLEFPAIGWPDAPKGGTIRQVIGDWPATLRIHGESWNGAFNATVSELCAETLLEIHPTTLEWIPRLATHWKVSPDRRTFTYRINPAARFSDGTELTSADVLASYDLRLDPTCRDPGSVVSLGRLERPVAKSKYVVEVRAKDDTWLNFLAFAQMTILPAKEISIPGKDYVDRYQNSYTAMSGPYIVRPEDIKMGQSIAITRRRDWWRANDPSAAGTANIDRLEFEVVRDASLVFEKFKKGDVDLWSPGKAQWWVEEFPKLDAVKRGLVQRQKFFNDAPLAFGGFAMNTKRAPLDDVRVRRALHHLYNRRLFIAKLFYGEYAPISSSWPGTAYANPDNEVVEYDPLAAVALLEEAGWKDFDARLCRVKEGKPLEIELLYDDPNADRHLTLYQEDCKKAGVFLKLKVVTQASRGKNAKDKEFEMVTQGWLFSLWPDPDSSMHSRLAAEPGNTNITSFSDPRVDELIALYNREHDANRRAELLREMDGIVHKACTWVLGWNLPCLRFAYWNKLRFPPWGTPRTRISYNYWFTAWVDAEKERALEAARRDPSKTLPMEDPENKFWRAWNAVQRRKEKGASK